jgi:hypothetical protein
MAAKAQDFEFERPGEAGAELLQAAQEIFGPLCKAAWLSGSYAYRGARQGRSDADIVIVLDDGLAVPADNATLGLIRRFVDAYLAVHARHGLDPDLEFPGEFVTPEMIAETIAWRGLAHEGGLPDPAFPPVESSDHWLDRPDRWYNAWLSEIAFSRFPVCDVEYHDQVKIAGWATVLRFLLLREPRVSLTPDELLLGVVQFGVKPRYPDFWTLERPWVDRALEALAAEGMVGLRPDLVERRIECLRAWESGLLARIEADDRAPPLVLDRSLHRDVEHYARGRWETIGHEAAA